jgi:hypothetical protein
MRDRREINVPAVKLERAKERASEALRRRHRVEFLRLLALELGTEAYAGMVADA